VELGTLALDGMGCGGGGTGMVDFASLVGSGAVGGAGGRGVGLHGTWRPTLGNKHGRTLESPGSEISKSLIGAS
jgi:hypothetical protein